jgi:hypothetical protein
MADIYEGRCVCKAVHFAAHGAALRSHACHCTFCQRRTGSASQKLRISKQRMSKLTAARFLNMFTIPTQAGAGFECGSN